MDGTIVIETSVDTKLFDRQIKYIEERMLEIEYQLEQADKGFEVGDTTKLEAEYERLNNQLLGLIKKRDEFNNQGLSNLTAEIGKIGQGITGIIKKVGRWALAIFGIRGAYMAVRNAINVISQGDKQIAKDIQFMKTALAYTLEPVVRAIVGWMRTLMQYLQYIIKAWTGRDIFASASKNLKGASKSAKQLSKTLAGFDEMNVLSSNNGGGASGGIGNVKPLEAGEVPGWLEWLGKNGELVKKVIEGIGIAIASLKIAEFLKTLGLFSNLPLWKLTSGIALILGGLIITIKGIVDFIKDPSWDNFLTILEGIALVVAGIALLMGGWTVAVVALGVAIVTHIIKNWDKVKEILNKAKTWINDKFIEPIKEKFNKLPNWAQKLIKGIVNTAITMLNGLITGINAFMLPLRGAITIIGKVLGKNWTLDKISIPKIPYLAKGGIVNMPGRGVPIGSALGGEKGQEGVIPLTDSQQMALLGEAIGRYITINATITNTMNGRVISRELQKIQQQNSFANNR